MEVSIIDGTGNGKEAQVDANHRLKIQGQTETEQVHAAKTGDAYNIHTGAITLSAAGTALYVKNNEDRDLVIQGMVVALGTASTSDSAEVLTYKNITAGDLLTDATPVDFQSNRNYGSSTTLTVDAYKGKSAGTVTGDQVGLYYMSASSRMFAEVNKVLPKGATMGVYVDPKLSSGTVKMYCVFVTHLRDAAE